MKKAQMLLQSITALIIGFVAIVLIVSNTTLLLSPTPRILEPREHTVGVILLNYKRPHNLRESLPILSSYSCIDKIVVSHGHPEHADTSFRHDKVRHIMDFANNERYGGARRFLNVRELDTDFVLFLDDDMVPSEPLLAEMYNVILTRDTLAGPFGRSCTRSHGYSNPLIFGSYNVSLTGILMCRRSFVMEYLRRGFPRYEKWLVDHHGNCEDLSLNAFLHEEGRRPYVARWTRYHELDGSQGYHSNSDHYRVRSDFCRRHFPLSK